MQIIWFQDFSIAYFFIHVPEIVSFSQSIKGWHLVTASRQRAWSGVILDNCLPASCNAAFMVVSGRCLNSLFIYIKKSQISQKKKEQIAKKWNFYMVLYGCKPWARHILPSSHPDVGETPLHFQGYIFVFNIIYYCYFKTLSSVMGTGCQWQVQNWQYHPIFKLRFDVEIWNLLPTFFPPNSIKK